MILRFGDGCYRPRPHAWPAGGCLPARVWWWGSGGWHQYGVDEVDGCVGGLDVAADDGGVVGGAGAAGFGCGDVAALQGGQAGGVEVAGALRDDVVFEDV